MGGAAQADRLKRQRQEVDQKDNKMRGRDQDPDQRMTDLEEKIDQLSANIGEGSYQQPLLTARAQNKDIRKCISYQRLDLSPIQI